MIVDETGFIDEDINIPYEPLGLNTVDDTFTEEEGESEEDESEDNAFVDNIETIEGSGEGNIIEENNDDGDSNELDVSLPE